MTKTLHPALDPIPVESVIHVEASEGPSELTCRACGLLMIPGDVFVNLRENIGMSECACYSCWRGVRVTWGENL